MEKEIFELLRKNKTKMINFSTGQKVRCIKDDPKDDRYGIPNNIRWHIGDEFIIDRVEVLPYGTFLCDNIGNNLNAKRAIIVD
jgi:hypothetical protein